MVLLLAASACKLGAVAVVHTIVTKTRTLPLSRRDYD